VEFIFGLGIQIKIRVERKKCFGNGKCDGSDCGDGMDYVSSL